MTCTYCGREIPADESYVHLENGSDTSETPLPIFICEDCAPLVTIDDLVGKSILEYTAPEIFTVDFKEIDV